MADETYYYTDQYDYPFNTEEDKIRHSHDVRVYEDGTVVRLNPKTTDDSGGGGDGGDGGAEPDTTNSSDDPNFEGDAQDGTDDDQDKKSYVDLRRTDELHVLRGRAGHWQRTFYHLVWLNDGCDMPDNRGTETKTIRSGPADSGNGSDAASGGPGEITADSGDSGMSDGETPEDGEEVPVDIDVITSCAIATVLSGSRTQVKRWRFDNSDHGGRRVIVKDVGSNVKVEVLKTYFANGATGPAGQETRFNVPIWGDPKFDPTVYTEGGSGST